MSPPKQAGIIKFNNQMPPAAANIPIPFELYIPNKSKLTFPRTPNSASVKVGIIARIKKRIAVSPITVKASIETLHNLKINKYWSKNTRYLTPEIKESWTNKRFGIVCNSVNKKTYFKKKETFASLFAKNGIAA